MRTLFDPTVRVLACDNCGAPLEGSSGSSELACGYCGAKNSLGLREELPPAAPLFADEHRRRLAAQVGRTRPSCAPPALLDGDRIAAWREREALAVWVQLRRQAHTADDTADRFFDLTRLLTDAAHRTGDEVRVRSLLETGYEVLRLPRHRTWFAAALAQRAALAGDIPSAQAWIVRGDASTDDLEASSALTLASGLVARRDGPDAVLAVLGVGEGAAPLYPADEALGALLRAEALERQGRLDEAALVLERQALARWPMSRAELALAEQTLGAGAVARSRALFEERRGRVYDHGVRYNQVVTSIFALLWGSLAVVGAWRVSHHWAWIFALVGGVAASAPLIWELITERHRLGAWRRPVWATVKRITRGTDSDSADVVELELEDAPEKPVSLTLNNNEHVAAGMRAPMVRVGDSLRWLP